MKTIRFTLSAMLLAVSSCAWSSLVVHEIDYTTDFCNPERGFYHPVSQTFKSSVTASNFLPNTISGQRHSTNHSTLFLREYYLNNYRADSIPQYALNIILSDFETCRQAGGKLIIRFAYTSNSSAPYQDGTPDWWRIHLEQLKPILAQGEDVISCVQAGFLGVWGEWYYSSQGTGQNIKQAIKNTLIDQLLDAVPASRAIQVRTPNYKQKYLNKDTVPLTPEEAFNGSPKARIGHHNDAILNGESNMGTYQNRKRDMSYLNRDCRYLPNGGETDLTADQAKAQDVYNKYSTGAISDQELGYLHFSYLNSGYSGYVLSRWKAETVGDDNYYKIISRHLGYRFALCQTSFPDEVRPGGNLPLHMSMFNEGYATPYNERHAFIVLANGTDTVRLPMVSDPRFWTPNKNYTFIKETLTVPQDMPEGEYDVYLSLPDNAPNLANKPLFAIRLANVDCWDETTGLNNLKTKITVSASAPENPIIDPVSALRPINSNTKIYAAQKKFQNGRLFIQCGDRCYDVLGGLIK